MDYQDFLVSLQNARQLLAQQDEMDTGEVFETSDTVRLCKQPLVSVEVLAYNQGDTLEQCVESIASQKTTFPFEIIIGNNASEDNTAEIAARLGAKYPDKIRMLTTKRNVGLNRNARNVRRVMRGSLAAFCEGDDWWLSTTRLQEQVDIMVSNPQVTLCHGLSVFYYEKTESYRAQYARFKSPRNVFSHIFDETYRIETASVMCRVRDLLRIYNECPELIGAHFRMLDTQLFCLLASFGEVRLVNKLWSVRRISGKSLSQNSDLLSSARYHDSAFSMKMALCKYFHVGSNLKNLSINYYIHPLFIWLQGAFGRQKAVEMLLELYPEHKRNICFIGKIPPPKNSILKKIYFHYIFKVTRYRNMFATKPVGWEEITYEKH